MIDFACSVSTSNVKKLKISVIGAGSTYTPELMEGFIALSREVPVGSVCLMDVDKKRLRILSNFSRRQASAVNTPFDIVDTPSQKDAVKDADFVVTQVRVGGMRARFLDEKMGLKFNIVGQETTGAGGAACALRTIPAVLSLTRDMEKYARRAWLINFANPSGMVTEAVAKYSKINVTGLCNIPIGFQMEIARVYNAPPDKISLDYVGLNHLSWLRRVFVYGKDVTKEILNHKRLEDLTYFSKALLNTIGYIPSPYLQYYYNTAQILQKQRKQKMRSVQVMELEKKLLRLYSDPRISSKPKILEKRGGAYYSTAAVKFIRDMVLNKKTIHILNVKNNSAVRDLPPNCVVEVPCRVSASGVKPLDTGPVSSSIRGLLQQVKSYEELCVEAAVKKDKKLLVLALLNHPLVPSHLAEPVAEEIIKTNKPFIGNFH